MDKKTLQKIFRNVLGTLGFEGSKNSWIRHHSDTTDLVNLQGSQYSEACYLNVAIFVHTVSLGESYAERSAPLRCRPDLTSFPDLCSLLEHPGSFPEDVALTIIQDRLPLAIEPFFKQFSTLSEIEAFVVAKQYGGVWVRGELCSYFGVSFEAE